MAISLEQVVRPIDRWQQGNRAAGYVFAVVKKFGDDRGGYLVALITFYGFLSLFPLLLVAVTVLGFVLHSDPSLRLRIQTSALRNFPAVGADLQAHQLRGNPLALGAGLVGMLWGSLGVAQAIQFAVDEAWSVPNRDRGSFVVRLGRALSVLALIGLGASGTTALSSLGSIVGNSELAGVVAVTTAFAVNLSLILAVFRILSPRRLRWVELLPGAVLFAVGWQVLQLVGQSLVRHNLKHTTEVYGQFAVVLGLLTFVSLAAKLFVYAIEANVVAHRRMWPRSIVQPPLTRADREYLAVRAEAEVRRPEQIVQVRWSDGVTS